MLYIVDGTGSDDEEEYYADMSRGFCHCLYKKLGRDWAEYERGPTKWDFTISVREITEKVVSSIMSPSKKNLPIYLAGHSRGGAAVIEVAKQLKDEGIDVSAMFLFDAVDRALSVHEVSVVPMNVHACYHAIRNKNWKKSIEDELSALERELSDLRSSERPNNLGISSKWRKTNGHVQQVCKNLLYRIDSLKDDLRSGGELMRNTIELKRRSIPFDNCGLTWARDPNWKPQQFDATHGAMGGASTTTLAYKKSYLKGTGNLQMNDIVQMKLIDEWMSRKLIKHGLFGKENNTIQEHEVLKEMQAHGYLKGV